MNTKTLQPTLARSITKSASQQTYYTIRFLVDRERVVDAYRAYAYFRWVDDTLDANSFRQTEADAQERIAFLERQKSLLEGCYRDNFPEEASIEEKMLFDLVRQDHEKNSGLQSYLRNMMQVMDFDSKRRGKLISQAQLNEYTRWLAVAVTEAMHYFIGHGSYSPRDETRYFAVAGAHITHMLRDTYDDVQAGYYNIPREVLDSGHTGPQMIHSSTYRAWVQSRVQLARDFFKAGKEYLARVEEPRCRLAGLAYTARFEWLLDTLEQENYSIRPEYNERKSLGTGLRMSLSTLSSLFSLRGPELLPKRSVSHAWKNYNTEIRPKGLV